MRPQSVSVIVPAHNEERHIARCLGAQLANAYTDFEVIVVDDASTDATRVLVQSLAVAD